VLQGRRRKASNGRYHDKRDHFYYYHVARKEKTEQDPESARGGKKNVHVASWSKADNQAEKGPLALRAINEEEET